MNLCKIPKKKDSVPQNSSKPKIEPKEQFPQNSAKTVTPKEEVPQNSSKPLKTRAEITRMILRRFSGLKVLDPGRSGKSALWLILVSPTYTMWV